MGSGGAGTCSSTETGTYTCSCTTALSKATRKARALGGGQRVHIRLAQILDNHDLACII